MTDDLETTVAPSAIERAMSIFEGFRDRVLIGVGSRRRSAAQAIDLPSDGGGNLGRLFTGHWAEQAFVEAKSHFPAVARMVGFGLGKSKMLYLSMGIDCLPLRHDRLLS
jgi:hypothetical protein